MTRRKSAGRLAGATLALSLILGGASGCGFNFVGSKSMPEIAATVEGIEIPSSLVEELVAEYRKTEAGKEQDPTNSGTVLVSDKIVRQTALSYQIKITFLEALAKQRGVNIEEGEKGIFDDIQEAPSMGGSGVRGKDLEVAARAEKLQKAIARQVLPEVDVSESELKEAFEERGEALGESFTSETDLAFMDSEEDANALREAMKDEGTDFLAKARELEALQADSATISPLSPINGDFIAKVRGLQQGEVSDPIKFDVDDGSVFVVLHVAKRKDLKALTVEEVKEELTVIVQDKKRFQFFEQWFEKRFREADVDVDAYYGKWTPKSLVVS